MWMLPSIPLVISFHIISPAYNEPGNRESVVLDDRKLKDMAAMTSCTWQRVNYHSCQNRLLVNESGDVDPVDLQRVLRVGW
ncbi:hypothetical protein SCHPADRAFT_933977 [Schizopora paradoxa]|uniref:Uncharacterized protein n=1 Tax=Schizopora paradoxa TaxID=27342 RepID=A0A0H2QYT9_9AGAM|nr:hypothetical protein SCHPADRAFT_933977 [Schizopora paradoxa]